MTAPRTGRGQRPTGNTRPAAATPDLYTLLVGGLAQCTKCACLVPDTKPARETHSNHHTALRALWQGKGGTS